jgi:stage IV sporulation protein FB
MLQGDRTFRIGRVFGVEVTVGVSFLIIVALLTFMTGSLVMGGMMAIILLLVVLLHEMGHVLSAKSFGRDVYEVNLNGLGGVTKMERSRGKHGEDIIISFAGPAVNLCTAGAIFVGTSFIDTGSLPVYARMFIDHVYMWSLLLGVFNLLPAEPLDGGSIASSIVIGYTKVKNPTKVLVHLSLVSWVLLVGVAIYFWQPFLIFIGAYMALMSYRKLTSLGH